MDCFIGTHTRRNFNLQAQQAVIGHVLLLFLCLYSMYFNIYIFKYCDHATLNC